MLGCNGLPATGTVLLSGNSSSVLGCAIALGCGTAKHVVENLVVMNSVPVTAPLVDNDIGPAASADLRPASPQSMDGFAVWEKFVTTDLVINELHPPALVRGLLLPLFPAVPAVWYVSMMFRVDSHCVPPERRFS